MAESARAGAQGLLAQDAALSVHHREGRVVTDAADVAQVIRDPLELGHDAAQPHGTRGGGEVERAFDGPSERP